MTTTTVRIPDSVDPGFLAVGVAAEDWTGDARFFEYHQAVDPLRSGTITQCDVNSGGLTCRQP